MITKVNRFCCNKVLYTNQCGNTSDVTIRVVNLTNLSVGCSIGYFLNGNFNSIVSPILQHGDSYPGIIPINSNSIRVTVFDYSKVPPSIICVKSYMKAKNLTILIQGTPSKPTFNEYLLY